MLFSQVLILITPLIMASASASTSTSNPTADAVYDNETQKIPNQDIWMWIDHTHQAKRTRFLSVPITYELQDIKHADHVGMFWIFNNGETWLTLKEKRLFLFNDEPVLHPP